MISTRRSAVAALILPLCLLVSGCELFSGLTTSPSVSPSPAPSATNTGPVAQQMDQDYAAAEKAYRANVAELNRLGHEGGATKPSDALKATSEGPALKTSMELLRQLRSEGLRVKGNTDVVGISQTGWKPDELYLSGCEDITSVRLYDGSKNVTSKGPKFYLQRLTMRKTGASWRIYDETTEQLKSLDGQTCAS